MQNTSRSINSLKNIIVTSMTFGLQFVVSFFCRSFFVKKMGVEYLGLDNVYINIIGFLALADLGIDTAFQYALYQPLANKNYQLVTALVDKFRTIYIFIAIAVFFLGCLVVPALKWIIPGSTLPISLIIIFYMMYLINSVCSYLGICKSIVIQANEKVYVVKTIRSSATIVCNIFQIYFLYRFNSYFLYVFILILSTIGINLLVSFWATKSYPYLKKNNEYYKLQKSDYSTLYKNIISTLVYKLGTTLINSTSSIIISILFGAVYVGFYSNYQYIIKCLNSFIGILTVSLIPSIGNYLVLEKNDSKLQMFETLNMVFFVIATICTSILLVNFNTIITCWLGSEYVIRKIDVYAIIFAFYLQCISTPNWMFRETSGLFVQIKKIIIIFAILNIGFSFILGPLFGIAGIAFATCISRLMTVFWYEPYLLFKNTFKKNIKFYWKSFFSKLSVSTICLFLVYCMSFSKQSRSLWDVISTSLISLLVATGSFGIIYRDSTEIKYIQAKLVSLYGIIQRKVKK